MITKDFVNSFTSNEIIEKHHKLKYLRIKQTIMIWSKKGNVVVLMKVPSNGLEEK